VLRELRGLTALSELGLYGTFTTQAGRDALRASLPALTVEGGEGVGICRRTLEASSSSRRGSHLLGLAILVRISLSAASAVTSSHATPIASRQTSDCVSSSETQLRPGCCVLPEQRAVSGWPI